ncbi:MAG TPA: response regulator transcription factor [Solimonas sp.]|nr:response regulator transcription factor [Solimonas sp.]
MGEPVSVFVVEDDVPTRERLARAVEKNPGFRLAGSAGTCADARRQLARGAPAVLLVDLGLPDGDGAELIAEMHAAHPATLSMVITVFGDEAHVVHALEAGASGYLLKDASIVEIGRAIADLLAGGSPISPAVARHVLNRFMRATPVRKPATPAVLAEHLTEREIGVLELVAKGYAYGEVGATLGLSVNTIAFHIKQIYRKLAVHSRGEAVFEATQLGLLNRPPAA